MESSHLWILPFVFFCAGYFFVSVIGGSESVNTPSVIGFTLHDAVKTLSAARLTAAIKAEKEDAHLVEGTIINQSPHPGQKVKPQQSVYLVVSTRPPTLKAPSLVGLSHDNVQSQAEKAEVRLKTWYVESHYPKNTCIAQIPAPGTELAEKNVHVYISSGTTPLRLVPDVRGRRVNEVVDFLRSHDIEIKFFSGEEPQSDDIIRDQRPVPGSLINIAKKITFYVRVDSSIEL
jgi:eukaryotic-like serine/threonine-protein kinase